MPRRENSAPLKGRMARRDEAVVMPKIETRITEPQEAHPMPIMPAITPVDDRPIDRWSLADCLR